MKLVEADSLDSIADYRLIEREAPSPGPGEVLVRVRACGVGYVDSLVSLGRYQVKPPLPHIPGSEVGGVVEALGRDVQGLHVGQRVMASARGGFAELAIAPATLTTPIPDVMSFEAAAVFRVNYLTAMHGLLDRAVLKPGERLLVMGAAGGVGAAAVQIGALLQARVLAAASTEEKRAFATAHGAVGTLDTVADESGAKAWRGRLKALCDGSGPDVVFDPVCGPLFEAAFRSLAWGGRHLVVGFTGGPIPSLPSNLPLMKGAGLLGVDVRQFLLFEETRAASHLDTLLRWVAEGSLVPPVGKVFALDEFKPALEFAMTGRGVGKAVLVIEA